MLVGASTGDAEFAKPAVALDASGAAVIAWVGRESGHDVIEASYRPAGSGSFSAPATLSATNATAGPPDVAITAAGKAIVAWGLGDEVSGNHFAQASTHGTSGGFGAAQGLNGGDDLGTPIGFTPRLAVDPGGNAVVVFPSRRSGGLGTIAPPQWARMTAGSSQFGAPGDVAPNPAGGEPDVALDGAGAATVVWSTTAGEVKAVSQIAAGGAFGSADTVSDDGAAQARVGVDAGGEAVVVFQTEAGGSHAVMWAAGVPGAFGDPQQLSSPGDSGDARVAVDDDGNAAAVWTRSDGSKETVEGAYRPAGGAFGTPSTLTKSGYPGNLGAVAIDGSGVATAAWRTTNFFGIVWSADYPDGSPPDGGGGDSGGGGDEGSGAPGGGGGPSGGGSDPASPGSGQAATPPPSAKPAPAGKKKALTCHRGFKKKVHGKQKCVKAKKAKPGKKKR